PLIIVILSAFTAFYFYIDMQTTRDAKDVSILQGSEKQPKTALTFNVSWGNEVIYDILSTLKKDNIRATFFISGEWAERHQHIIDLMKEDKHEIAFNGNRYTNYLNDDAEEMKRDIV